MWEREASRSRKESWAHSGSHLGAGQKQDVAGSASKRLGSLQLSHQVSFSFSFLTWEHFLNQMTVLAFK